jgi:hypothetical protein
MGVYSSLFKGEIGVYSTLSFDGRAEDKYWVMRWYTSTWLSKCCRIMTKYLAINRCATYDSLLRGGGGVVMWILIDKAHLLLRHWVVFHAVGLLQPLWIIMCLVSAEFNRLNHTHRSMFLSRNRREVS